MNSIDSNNLSGYFFSASGDSAETISAGIPDIHFSHAYLFLQNFIHFVFNTIDNRKLIFANARYELAAIIYNEKNLISFKYR